MLGVLESLKIWAELGSGGKVGFTLPTPTSFDSRLLDRNKDDVDGFLPLLSWILSKFLSVQIPSTTQRQRYVRKIEVKLRTYIFWLFIPV
jgi:hypothetical protein